MKAHRTLVVEDDVMIGELLAETLEGLGHTSLRGREQCRRCGGRRRRHRRPDLMIVDIGLGEASGIAAVKEILRGALCPARVRDRRCVREFDAGPDAVLIRKPFRVSELEQRLNGRSRRPHRSPRSHEKSRVDMTHAALSPLIGPEFDEFLFAAIGEDRNGTTLSVLSALARLDVDPWREATSLARMSREAAAERLTALIDTLPCEPASAIPSKTSAAALVALLPKSKSPAARPYDAVVTGTGLSRTQTLLAVGAFAVMMLVVAAVSTRLSPGPKEGANSSAHHVAETAAAAPRKPGL